MADQQEQMTLVAKLVDQVSDKLKEINKAMLATEAASRKAHKGGAESADKHRKSVELLHKSFEQIKEASVELIKPSFAALGISAFSLAGAIGAVVESVKNLGEQGLALEKTARRSGLLFDKIRELQGIGLRWGTTIEQTNEGLSQFGDIMAQTERRAPQAMRMWFQMPGLWEKLGRSLQGLTRQQQIDKTLDFVTGSVKNIDQKRYILARLGLPENYAYLMKKELDEARHEEHALIAAHGNGDKFEKIAKAADEAFTKMSRNAQLYREDIGVAFGPEVIHGMEAFNHFLEDTANIEKFKGAMHGLAEQLKNEFRDIKDIYEVLKKIWDGPDIKFLKKTPGELFFDRSKSANPKSGYRSPNDLTPEQTPDVEMKKTPGEWYDFNKNRNPKSGYKPVAFSQSSSETQHVEETIYRATLRALTEWYQQVLFGNKTKGGNKGGNGFQNMSFGGSDGAARGGGWGNKDYPSVDDGSMPPSPGGARAPAMPSGTKRENAQRIYDELRRLGHSHEQASGALGHVQAESSFNPGAPGDGGTAHGFFQHRGSRWRTAMRDAKNAGASPFSPEAAARHFDRELRNEEAKAGRRYFNSKSTQDAVTALNGYERFAGWQRGQRKRYQSAEQFARTMKPSEQPTAAANGSTFQDLWQDRYGATRPGVSSRNTDGGLMKDSQSFNDRWNDRVNGNANISVDFKNMPHWARTAVDTEGKMFKELKVNRGFSMPTANEDH